MGPQYKHPTCTWQRIWAGAYYFKPKIHHLRNYTGGQSINIRKREDQGQTQQTSLSNSKSYCRAVTINYFLMYQWSCWCWAAFHFEIFWAEFHPQYFRLLSISSEYSARLFAAGSSISHRIKIKLTSQDFCKRVRSDLFLTAGLGLYTSPLKMCNTSLKSSCSSSFPASLTYLPSCTFQWLVWGLLSTRLLQSSKSPLHHGLWSLKTSSLTSALQWPSQTGLEHLHQHLSRTWSPQSSPQYLSHAQTAALYAPHSISSAAFTGSASNTAFFLPDAKAFWKRHRQNSLLRETHLPIH